MTFKKKFRSPQNIGNLSILDNGGRKIWQFNCLWHVATWKGIFPSQSHEAHIRFGVQKPVKGPETQFWSLRREISGRLSQREVEARRATGLATNYFFALLFLDRCAGFFWKYLKKIIESLTNPGGLKEERVQWNLGLLTLQMGWCED